MKTARLNLFALVAMMIAHCHSTPDSENTNDSGPADDSRDIDEGRL